MGKLPRSFLGGEFFDDIYFGFWCWGFVAVWMFLIFRSSVDIFFSHMCLCCSDFVVWILRMFG